MPERRDQERFFNGSVKKRIVGVFILMCANPTLVVQQSFSVLVLLCCSRWCMAIYIYTYLPIYLSISYIHICVCVCVCVFVGPVPVRVKILHLCISNFNTGGGATPPSAWRITVRQTIRASIIIIIIKSRLCSDSPESSVVLVVCLCATCFSPYILIQVGVLRHLLLGALRFGKPFVPLLIETKMKILETLFYVYIYLFIYLYIYIYIYIYI